MRQGKRDKWIVHWVHLQRLSGTKQAPLQTVSREVDVPEESCTLWDTDPQLMTC